MFLKVVGLLFGFGFLVSCGSAEEELRRPPSLSGAGWSFGECADSCRGDLAIDEETARYILSDWNPAIAAYLDNSGTLTERFGTESKAALNKFWIATLSPTYGCPDCADGGASYISLRAGHVKSRHDYEYSNPPSELAELDRVLREVMDGLGHCVSNEYIMLQSHCVLSTD